VPRARLLLVFLIAACSSEGGGEPKPPPPPMPEYLVDAAPEPAPTPLPAYDPASGYHLDDAEGGSAVRRPDRAAPRERRFLALMLKSTPSGAIAAVDGKVLGRTPLFWEGEFTGREREFTFVLPGYSMARYRFVPVRDGFVHGRLEKVATDPGDAGVPAIPAPEPEGQRTVPAPQPRPVPVAPPIDAAPPPPPAPPDAAPAPAPQDAGL
jgi:hypothetical protein